MSRRLPFTIALLAVLVASACSSESSPNADASVTRLDASRVDATTAIDGAPVDAQAPDAATPDAAPPCGCADGQYCDALGACQSGPAPTGAFCGPTPTCLSDDPGYSQCAGQQCASNNCGSAPTQAGVLIIRDVCIQPCQVYKDQVDEFGNNGPDGINDADALQEDCAPLGVFDGPAGTSYRCVNTASPASAPAAVCLPGTNFAECITNADCPADEACELMVINGAFELHCKARDRENSEWPGTTVHLGEACNANPGNGALAYCADGMCVDDLCSATCATEADCDTTLFATATTCVNQVCANDGTTSCEIDADCSTMTCTRTIETGPGSLSFTVCEAKN